MGTSFFIAGDAVGIRWSWFIPGAVATTLSALLARVTRHSVGKKLKRARVFSMSSLITWNDSYSVKVGSFDKQHQRLFDIMNRLHEAMGVGKGQTQIKTVLQELIDYTTTHFASEEAMLEKQGYPSLAAHKAEHKALLDKVQAYQKDFLAGKAGIASSLLQFLVEWLKRHIQQTDKKYGQFLNDHGVH